MARIRGVGKRAGWFYRLSRFISMRTLGAETEPLRVLGHHSGVLAATGAYHMLGERAKSVPAQLKALATIKAALLVGCHF